MRIRQLGWQTLVSDWQTATKILAALAIVGIGDLIMESDYWNAQADPQDSEGSLRGFKFCPLALKVRSRVWISCSLTNSAIQTNEAHQAFCSRVDGSGRDGGSDPKSERGRWVLCVCFTGGHINNQRERKKGLGEKTVIKSCGLELERCSEALKQGAITWAPKIYIFLKTND